MSNGQNQEIPTGPDNQDSEIKDPKAVLEKNRELLGKNKAMSAQLKELQDKFTAIEQDKLQIEGKKDELIESFKKKISDLESEKNKLGWNFVSGQIAVEAAKRGCINTATLMKVVDFENASINVNDYQIAKEDVEAILDKASKEHEYLFKKNVSAPKDGGIGQGVPKFDPKTASIEDLKNMYRNL